MWFDECKQIVKTSDKFATLTAKLPATVKFDDLVFDWEDLPFMPIRIPKDFFEKDDKVEESSTNDQSNNGGNGNGGDNNNNQGDENDGNRSN